MQILNPFKKPETRNVVIHGLGTPGKCLANLKDDEEKRGIGGRDSKVGKAYVTSPEEVKHWFEKKDINPKEILRVLDYWGGAKDYSHGKNNIWVYHAPRELKKLKESRKTCEVACFLGGIEHGTGGPFLANWTAEFANAMGALKVINWPIVPRAQDVGSKEKSNIAMFLSDWKRQLKHKSVDIHNVYFQNPVNQPLSMFNKTLAKAMNTFCECFTHAVNYDRGDFNRDVRSMDTTFSYAERWVGNDVKKSIYSIGKEIATKPPFLELNQPFEAFREAVGKMWIGVTAPLHRVEADELARMLKAEVANNTELPPENIVVAPANSSLNAIRAVTIYALDSEVWEMTQAAEIFEAAEYFFHSPRDQEGNIRSPVMDFVERIEESIHKQEVSR